MALPDAVQPYWLQQQRIKSSIVAIALRSWQVSGGNSASWQSSLPLLVAQIERAQANTAVLAAQFVSATLTELNLPDDPAAVIDPTPLIGRTGAGWPIGELYAGLPAQMALNASRIAQQEQAVIQPDIALPAAQPSVFGQAMAATALQLERSLQTVIADTGRAAESLEIAVRPGTGYVRMLNPPSCKRCVVQAGKFFRWNSGFKRHPRCDCRHIPARESMSSDMRVDPDRYFRSLSAADQEAAFGKAGAQAIRDGANLGQVVNADTGMRVAQVYGKNLAITDQGVTKYGFAGQVIRARGRNAATTPRLMPSSIYQIADDRADALRLLKINGYVMPDGAKPKDITDLLAS